MPPRRLAAQKALGSAILSTRKQIVSPSESLRNAGQRVVPTAKLENRVDAHMLNFDHRVHATRRLVDSIRRAVRRLGWALEIAG
jgi:hypothetical protein